MRHNTTFTSLAMVLLFCLAGFTSARAITVTGTVYEETFQPMLGANVMVKGTKTGAVTDMEGKYSLSGVSPGSVLVFSFIGYQMKEITTGEADQVIDVTLEPDLLAMEEAVTVSYRMLTGSISGITAGRSKSRIRGTFPAPSYNEMKAEDYNVIKPNQFIRTTDEALSTFSIDVDQASYTNVRRMIEMGQQIPKDAVRTEEFINYFKYDYLQPQDGRPVSITAHYTDCPWNQVNKLMMIGIKAKEIDRGKLPASNFVFLIDTSGSMNSVNRLPLAVTSFKMLVDQMREDDRVAIVTYSGSAGLALASTSGKDKQTIKKALDKLGASGSTAGGEGIELAYKIAKENFIRGGNNRVILATDGDFNVGASTTNALENLISDKRKENIFLTVLGFGMGNYKDSMVQTLAEKGNGNHAYIDTAKEAERIIVGQFAGTAFTLAKDMKIQVEFNPAVVEGYRLIGYESRMLDKEDFNDDTKDAGEIGMGQTVTAIYQIIPLGVKSPYLRSVDTLRYQKKGKKEGEAVAVAASDKNEVAFVKVRYKEPEGGVSVKFDHPVTNKAVAFANAGNDMRFAAAVAEFAQILSESEFKADASFKHVLETAQSAKGEDTEGERAEFIRLVRTVMATRIQ